MATPYPPALTLTPVHGPVRATVTLPGSKSLTNRALLLASLAEGSSTLRGPLHSEDTAAMSDCLRALGVSIMQTANGDFHVAGRRGEFAAPPGSLHAGASGTTLRFLTAASCYAPPGSTVLLDGVERMRERPVADLLAALTQLGVNAQSVHASGCPPVLVRGGGMRGGTAGIRGGISSQFLSAVLMASPLAQSDVTINVTSQLISKPYVDLTQQVMAAFGADMEHDAAYTRFHVPAGQTYQAADYAVEADASAASYFLAAAALTGGTVTLSNLGTDTTQGDARFVDVLEQMGCTVTRGPQISVSGPAQLKAINVNMDSIPDTAQTLAVLCAFADGPSRITGIASLRVKETDRVRAVAAELGKMGVRVEAETDAWTITPPAEGPHGAAIDTYQDHRMAMSFAVAGLRVSHLMIENPACVAKTFPAFWDKWAQAFPA